MSHRKLFVTLVLLLLFSPLIILAAQEPTNESPVELKRRANELLKETKYTEVLPILEKLATLDPNDGETQFFLGFALLGQAANTKDNAARKALRIRSRKAFLKAESLQFSEPRLEALIKSLPEDGSDSAGFSSDTKANELMKEGEALFSQGKADEALKKYQQALEIDPKLYHAALFSGDIYLHKQDFEKAETWYQKAIAIDPNKETAYRYSATPLMRQRKTEAARDRYVEAFITEPYNQFARAGLIQWGEATQTSLAHPDIAIPTNVTFDEKGDAKINLDDNALFRHPDLAALRDLHEEEPLEVEASKHGLNYIKLDGQIGCMVNGAGLAMATMDVIKLYGGEPANFLDVGGGATTERVTAAFKIMLSNQKVKGILVNIFGGIMKCDTIATGIVAAAREVKLSVPLVVRMKGTNEDLGKQILEQSGLPIISADNMAEAGERAVAAVQKGAK